MTSPYVSIVIPMLNEEKHIEKCLISLFNNDYPLDLIEVLVFDGGSTDTSVQIVKDLQAKYPVKVFKNDKKYQSYAVNEAAKIAKGHILIRADAHAMYSKDYLSIIVSHFERDPTLGSVGGIFDPISENLRGQAIALATKTFLGSGGASYRSESNREVKFVDTVPYGAWIKGTFLKIGGFNTDWLINEDYEFNIRLRLAGKKILLDPNLVISYRCRDRFIPLMKQYFRYGFWRAKTCIEYPSSIKIKYVVPAIYAAALFVSIALCLFESSCMLLLSTLGALFLAIIYVVSRRAFSPPIFGLTLWALFVLLNSFSIGLLLGSGRWLLQKLFNKVSLTKRRGR